MTKCARVIVASPDVVEGVAVVTDEALSFWGGVDPATGCVIDEHHPLRGECLAGRVLLLPRGRGSCSASGVLLECIHQGTAPAAIITRSVDPVLGLGAILADEVYSQRMPLLVITPEEWQTIETGDSVTILPSGEVTRNPGG
ncbi:MAG: aconitase X swivel domain-containing protein [Thermomicrobiales bacterium]